MENNIFIQSCQHKEKKIFVTGVYGSGKTTYAKEYAKAFGLKYIDFDMYFNYAHTLSCLKFTPDAGLINILSDNYIIDGIPWNTENVEINIPRIVPFETSAFMDYAKENDVLIVCCVCTDKDAWVKRLSESKKIQANHENFFHYREFYHNILPLYSKFKIVYYDTFNNEYFDSVDQLYEKIKWATMNKKVYIDVGSNLGTTIKNWQTYFNVNNEFEVHAFECNPNLWSSLQIPGVILHKEAAWIDNSMRSFFLDETLKSEGSSFEPTKTSGKMSSRPIDVPCLDFSNWLKNSFSKEDHIVLKLNIEGAEYSILEKMIKDGTISMIKKLFIWWHYIPYHFANLTKEQAETHERVFRMISDMHIIAPPKEGMMLLFGEQEPS